MSETLQLMNSNSASHAHRTMLVARTCEETPMHNSTVLDSLAALVDSATRGTGIRGDTSIAVHCRGPAANETICEKPAGYEAEIEAWAQHARGTNGFGDFAPGGSTAPSRPGNQEVRDAARALRSRILGGIVVAAIRKACALVRRALARHRQRRQTRAFHDALRQLDDHTLRDLGFHRSEIKPVAAEVTGEAKYARPRVLPMLLGLPI
jgi:uncharacterized protein YjiS (DUF1127 family)